MMLQFGSAKPSVRPTQPRPAQSDDAADASGPENESGKGSGSASPPITGNHSPPMAEGKPSNIPSPQSSRSPSPATVSAIGSRTASPASFRYPFHPPMQSGIFDTHTPAAIRG